MLQFIQVSAVVLLSLNLFSFFKGGSSRELAGPGKSGDIAIRIDSTKHAVLVLVVTASCMLTNFISLVCIALFVFVDSMRWVFILSLLLEVTIPLLVRSPAKIYGYRASLTHFRAMLSGGVASAIFL